MEKQIEEALNLYLQIFDDGFPTIPLRYSRSDEEILKMINNCIEQKKDVFQLGYYKLPEDDEYD